MSNDNEESVIKQTKIKKDKSKRKESTDSVDASQKKEKRKKEKSKGEQIFINARSEIFTLLSSDESHGEALTDVSSKKEKKKKRKLEAEVAATAIADQDSAMVVDSNPDSMSFVAKPMLLFDI